jgi:hypothetical protein
VTFTDVTVLDFSWSKKRQRVTKYQQVSWSTCCISACDDSSLSAIQGGYYVSWGYGDRFDEYFGQIDEEVRKI